MRSVWLGVYRDQRLFFPHLCAHIYTYMRTGMHTRDQKNTQALPGGWVAPEVFSRSVRARFGLTCYVPRLAGSRLVERRV
ncbi:unnamed protein product [Protopolystoma xenopodis]|uniref:Uncharacterized protein n=1 Tax=Protopolystoma xenopodis TaxID=117903 RepID=A0A3S5B8T8_9PLAT|nr:unnamed protein product [Protopolystoma xenopodis]